MTKSLPKLKKKRNQRNDDAYVRDSVEHRHRDFILMMKVAKRNKKNHDLRVSRP